MNYATAHQLIETQVMGTQATGAQAVKSTPSPGAEAESLLVRLGQGQAPIPGQITSILLALKIIYEALQGQEQLDRATAALLHRLAWESRLRYTQGLSRGVDWPPLLEKDLGRIAAAVEGIFTNNWPDIHHSGL